MRKDVYKKIIPIIITSFVSWFYVVSYVPLGYIYNAFPGKDSTVILISTLPSLAVMASSFLAAPLLRYIKPKIVTVIGLALTVISGLGVRFFGEQNLMLCVVMAFIGGLPAGLIQAANYISLQEIAPLDMRDKVTGWCDACCGIGMATATVLSGLFIKDGAWIHAYDLYWISVVVLVVGIIFYPNVTQKSSVETVEKIEDTKGAKATIPLVIIGIIILRFVGPWGYQGHLFFTSDFIVNESNFMTAQTYGVAEGLGQFFLGIAAAFIFVVLRFFKGYSYSAGLILCAVCTLVFMYAKQAWLSYPLFILYYGGMSMIFTGAASIISMSCKGKALILATSLSLAATYCGEFLSSYVDPFLAKLVFGEVTASNALISSALYCVVLAIIAIPIFNKGYKYAYAALEAEKAASK